MLLPQPSEGQIPILPGLMQGPIPAGLVLIIEIVLVSPTTRAPKPGERSSDPAEHGRLPLVCPCDALSSLPDARTRRPAALVSSVRVATGPRSVRTGSGICGYERAGAVTTGTKKLQVAAPSRPRPPAPEQHGGGFESHLPLRCSGPSWAVIAVRLLGRGQARALAFRRSNSAWSIVPASSSCLARAICSVGEAVASPVVATDRT